MNFSLSWPIAASLSLFSFGLWGLFAKLSVRYVDSKSALIYQAAGFALIGLLILYFMQFKPAAALKGITFGMLTGIASGIGCLFFLLAINKGKVTTVVTMTALYPIITIVLAFILLKEGITLRQGLGILFALMAIYLFI